MRGSGERCLEEILGRDGVSVLLLLWLSMQAIKYHKQELTISKEVNDRSSEASTHGNLAVAYQALGAHEMALLHYRAHLNTARELKDTAGEACALLNLGNCLSSRGEFSQAVPFYENYLMLSQVPHVFASREFVTSTAYSSTGCNIKSELIHTVTSDGCIITILIYI